MSEIHPKLTPELKPPQEWVAGFLFQNQEWVFLIRKAKPEWQKGKRNGVGGKIEPGETPLEAMNREWQEETLGAPAQAWWSFCTLDWKDGRVHFFAAESNLPGGRFSKFNEKGAEPIECYEIKETLWYGCIPNLRWLIPMALDKDRIVSTVSEPDAWNTRPQPVSELKPPKLMRESWGWTEERLKQCWGHQEKLNIGLWNGLINLAIDGLRSLPEPPDMKGEGQ